MASFPVRALVLRREGASDESCSAWPATIAFARGPNGLFCNIGREGDAEHAQWLTFKTTHPTVSRKHMTLVATPDCSSAVATQHGQNGTGVCAPADGSRWVKVARGSSHEVHLGSLICLDEKARTGRADAPRPVLYRLVAETVDNKSSLEMNGTVLTGMSAQLQGEPLLSADAAAAAVTFEDPPRAVSSATTHVDAHMGAHVDAHVHAFVGARLTARTTGARGDDGCRGSVDVADDVDCTKDATAAAAVDAAAAAAIDGATDGAATTAVVVDGEQCRSAQVRLLSASFGTSTTPILLSDSQPNDEPTLESQPDDCVLLSDSPVAFVAAPVAGAAAGAAAAKPSHRAKGKQRARDSRPRPPEELICLFDEDEDELTLGASSRAGSSSSMDGGSGKRVRLDGPQLPSEACTHRPPPRMATAIHGSAAASIAAAAAALANATEEDGSAVQIIIDIDDDDDSDDGDGSGAHVGKDGGAEAEDLDDESEGVVEMHGEDGPSDTVIDLTDDRTLARLLTKQLVGRGAVDAIDLEALQDARRRRLDQRRSTVVANADYIDCEDEASTDLLHEQRAGIGSFLQQRATNLVVSEVWHNPASKPGGKLYERFFAAWASAPNKRLRLVFHGTPEANVESICSEGLDPARRNGQAYGAGEYFGGDANVSLGYCRGGRKMIVFVVLLDPSGVTLEGPTPAGEMVVISKPEFQLPLAVITFSQRALPRQQPGHAVGHAFGHAIRPMPMPQVPRYMRARIKPRKQKRLPRGRA